MSRELKEFDIAPAGRKARGPRTRGSGESARNREDYYAELGFSAEEKMLACLSEEELAFAAEMCRNGCDRVKAYATVHRIAGDLTREQYRDLSTLLHDQKVRRAIRAGIQRRMSDVLDNLDSRLLNTYITRAFYDPSDFVDDNGDPLPLSEIPQDLRCVIDSIEKKYYGKSADACTITYRLANRDTALRVLSEFMHSVRPETGVTLTAPEDADPKAFEQQAEHLADMSYEELEAALQKIGG